MSRQHPHYQPKIHFALPDERMAQSFSDDAPENFCSFPHFETNLKILVVERSEIFLSTQTLATNL